MTPRDQRRSLQMPDHVGGFKESSVIMKKKFRDIRSRHAVSQVRRYLKGQCRHPTAEGLRSIRLASVFPARPVVGVAC